MVSHQPIGITKNTLFRVYIPLFGVNKSDIENQNEYSTIKMHVGTSRLFFSIASASPHKKKSCIVLKYFKIYMAFTS